MELVLLILLLVILLGAVPACPYSRGWGMVPVTSVEQMEAAFLERNGKISVIPR